MHIRCPHCHNPIEVVDADPITDVSCPACGSNFSLISGETASYTPGYANDFLVSPRGRGRWMQLVLYARMSSSPEVSDGEARIWRRWKGEDKFTMISESIGNAFHPPQHGRKGWAAGYILGWANASYAEDTEWLLDAFTVSEKSLVAAKNSV
jgi:hypothetical protein